MAEDHGGAEPPGGKLLRQWLVTDGVFGDLPQWYRIVKAAQYLGTTPWELAAMPWRYTLQAEEAQAAEAYAINAKKK